MEPPPQKRQKSKAGRNSAPLGPALAVSALLKCPVDLPTLPSPGSTSGCRVAVYQQVHDGGASGSSSGSSSGGGSTVFLASHSRVYQVVVPPQSHRPVQTGKGHMLLPQAAEGCSTHHVSAVVHQAEIQAIALTTTSGGGGVLVSVDSRGAGVMARVVLAGPGHGSLLGAGAPEPVAAVVHLQFEDNTTDPGWAGVSVVVDPGGGSARVALVRQLARDAAVFDGEGRRVRTFRTLQCPSALLLSDPACQPAGCTHSLLAVAEDHLLSLWDVRAGERGGLVQRLAAIPAGFPTHCMAWCPSPAGVLLGITGEDRTVSLLDTRKWGTQSKWASCVKNSARHLSFSVANPAHCFVAGMDYEVVCGRWDGRGAEALAASGAAAPAVLPGLGQYGRAVGPTQGQMAVAAAAAAATPAAGTTGRGATNRVAGPGDVPDNHDSGTAAAGGLSFRGDSRWLGVARAPGADVVAAFSQQGHLYIADFSAGGGVTVGLTADDNAEAV